MFPVLPLEAWRRSSWQLSVLTEAIQSTMHEVVLRWHPSPHSKRWWSRELTELKKRKNKLSNTSYYFWALPDHLVHEEHRAIRSKYSTAISNTKWEHWTAFLEGLSYSEVWMANHYISGENVNGGKTCIPTLTQQLTDPIWTLTVAMTNEEKSSMLAKLMFWLDWQNVRYLRGPLTTNSLPHPVSPRTKSGIT